MQTKPIHEGRSGRIRLDGGQELDRIIFSFTRAQAIADGVLVDVSEMAREAGIKFPTAVTASVWIQYVRVPEGVEGQDEKGRLWDILWMLRCGFLRRNHELTFFFPLAVRNDNIAPRPVKLKAVCHPGDECEPVITVMLPNED